MAKDKAWFQSINWDEACLNECHKANNGTCPMLACAEMHYDDNGNLIPASSVTFDGDYQETGRNANESNSASEIKTWEIYNYTYRDVCSDSWFGKEGNDYTIGFVTDTEENVKSLVDELNAKRNSLYPKNKPEDEWDRDFEDADYITYTEVKISTFDEIRNHYICRR